MFLVRKSEAERAAEAELAAERERVKLELERQKQANKLEEERLKKQLKLETKHKAKLTKLELKKLKHEQELEERRQRLEALHEARLKEIEALRENPVSLEGRAPESVRDVVEEAKQLYSEVKQRYRQPRFSKELSSVGSTYGRGYRLGTRPTQSRPPTLSVRPLGSFNTGSLGGFRFNLDGGFKPQPRLNLTPSRAQLTPVQVKPEKPKIKIVIPKTGKGSNIEPQPVRRRNVPRYW